MNYFHVRVSETFKDRDKVGLHFTAVTDAGSALEKTAKSRGFAHIFHGEPSVGGRYSVLSPFGLVPAAAAGISIAEFLDLTSSMVRSCSADVPPAENPGIQLGLAIGAAYKAGRDKLTLSSSQQISEFGAWAEQLIAESTGKNGMAIIPLADETLGKPAVYGNDRVFVDLRLKQDADNAREIALTELEKAGHPVVRITLLDAQHIGQEFFRFEIATAVASAVMGINPFDQPDVESAKIKTRELISAFEKSGFLPTEQPVATESGIEVYADKINATALRKSGAGTDVGSWLTAHLDRLEIGDYAALLVYLDRNDFNISATQATRMMIRDKKRAATCVGFGPRFLHSTGQAHKGGPNTGVFLQITSDDAQDLNVPDKKASFGIIKAAQALGDFGVLTDRRRRALRLHIKGDVQKGLATINTAIEKSLK